MNVDPDDDVGLLLTLAGVAAVANLAATLAERGLNPRSHTVLRMAAGRPGVAQHEVAELLTLNPSRLVGIVDDLEARGFVERLVDPRDRRARALYPTSAGLEEVTASAHAVAKALDHTLAGLDVARREELGRLLRDLVDGLTPVSRNPDSGVVQPSR